MDATSTKFATVDKYIRSFPPKIRTILTQVRKTIKAAAPGAEELISYNMPAFKLHGRLVYYAAWKNHLGFYPVTSGIKKFAKELAAYAGAKGSVQFPYDQPMPLELISRMVKFRVEENEEAVKKKIKRQKPQS